MKEFGKIASPEEIRAAITDLEQLATPEASAVTVAAIHVLKNELAPLAPNEHRSLLFERSFSLPGGLPYRIRRWFLRESDPRLGKAIRKAFANIREWLTGGRAENFRDRCDRFFWEEMVPVIEREFGPLAHPFMNTINEAIINYAEYSYRPWSFRRRVSAHIFRTEGDLAYGIVRPSGSRLRTFNPLRLRQKRADTLAQMRRGWGHTLLMRRALFISFDQAPRRRGLMIVVGAEEETSG